MFSLKKSFLALMAAAVLAVPVAGMTAPAAEAQMKVGTIDVQRILNGSSLMKALQGAQDQVNAAEQELIKFRDGKLKELQDLQKQVQEGKLKEDEFIKKQRELEDEMRNRIMEEQKKLNVKRDEIRKMKESLEKAVETAVVKVAGDQGYSMVVNKQMVLYGGTDITDIVMKAMPSL